MSVVNISRPEKNVVELEVSVSKEAFEEAVQKAFLKKRKSITVPGFRKGKATRGMIERFYGQEVFYEEAVNISYPDAYKEAYEEAGIEPVDRADVEIKDISPEGYSFMAKVTVKPEVKLKKYKGLAAEKRKAEVSDSEIDGELEALRRRNARLITITDRPAANGDTVLIDFEGFIDDVPFEGGKGEKYSLELGSNSFIPGFEDQLVGAAAGDEREVKVTFPEDYHAEELKGKDAMFKVKVNEIRFSELPELDDEFAKDVSEFDTLEQFKADIKAKRLEQAEKRAEDDMENQLLDALVAELEVDMPQVMADRQVDGIIQDFAYRLQMQGMDISTYLNMTGMDAEAFRATFAEQGERKAKIALAIDEVIKTEGLDPSDEEIEAEYERLAGVYNMEAGKLHNVVPREDVANDLKTHKAIDLIKAEAEISQAAEKTEEKPKKTRKPAQKKTAAKAEKDDSKDAKEETTDKKKEAKEKAEE